MPHPKIGGKTLGEVLKLDPHAINWVATKFTGDPEDSGSSKTHLLVCCATGISVKNVLRAAKPPSERRLYGTIPYGGYYTLIGIPYPPSGRSNYNIPCPCCDDNPRKKHLNINYRKMYFAALAVDFPVEYSICMPTMQAFPVIPSERR